MAAFIFIGLILVLFYFFLRVMIVKSSSSAISLRFGAVEEVHADTVSF
jgi:regulator of protease activity HflC (stomatin/prohibitin superfamily)